MRFSQLVPWKHQSVGRVLSGHQLGKPSDVRRIYQHTKVVLYLLYTQPEIFFNYCKEELCDMRHVIRTAISHGHIKKQITTVGSHRYIINLLAYSESLSSTVGPIAKLYNHFLKTRTFYILFNAALSIIKIMTM